MDVIEQTRTLCAAIQADERYAQYRAAKALNDVDADLQHSIALFGELRDQLNAELSGDEKDDEKVKNLNAEIKKTYGEIMTNENMINYNGSKSQLDALINSVNSIITLCVNGADPMTAEPETGCGGSCSSCAGCH